MSSNPRILLVKLSSLGDVIHNFPVATDIRQAFPDAVIDWVTDAPYAPLVALHPAIGHAFPVRLRELKARWFDPAAWGRLFDDKARLVAHTYDLVIDTQGLTKSALIARWPVSRVAGYDRDSIREPFASRCYHQRHAVSRELHALERNRTLAALALGYALPTACDYGLPTAWPALADVPQSPYVVCLHASSRADKSWAASSWIALAQELNAMGLHVVLPSGNAAEFAQSEYLARQLQSATALAAKSFAQTSALLANAQAVIGVDTGLAHLAVALKRPTIGLYLSTRPALTGLYRARGGGIIINIGGGTRENLAVIDVDTVLSGIVAGSTKPMRALD